jgi:hypothetical protein
MLSEFVVAVLALLFMMGAALIGFFSKTRVPAEHREDTSSVATLVGNLLVVMASVVIGFMINSAKDTYQANNRNIRTLATDIILLDRTIRGLGQEAEDARRHLLEYVEHELKHGNSIIFEQDLQSEAPLNAAGTSLKAIRVSDEQKVTLWNDALMLYRQIVHEYWVPASGGTIPTPLIIMLMLWLTIIFASFGYRVQRTTIVMALFFLTALLISAALYLILDMDASASAMFQVSNAPFQRALAQLQR